MQLHRRREELEEVGARLAAIGQGTPRHAQHFREEHGLDGLQVLWHEMPKGRGGQFGAQIAFSPDNRYLFLTVGDRQRMTPAQDPNQELGKILRLTLDNPPANALSLEAMEALQSALEAAANDDSTRVVVIAAAGKLFSGGHDLKQMTAHRADSDRGVRSS